MDPLKFFASDHYRRHNSRRLEHLAARFADRRPPGPRIGRQVSATTLATLSIAAAPRAGKFGRARTAEAYHASARRARRCLARKSPDFGEPVTKQLKIEILSM
jgi:hypothetical protein